MAEEEPVRLVIVLGVAVTNTCEECGEILTQGDVYVSFRFPDGRACALGYDPPLTCCGEPVTAIRVFDTKEEAEEALVLIVETLRKEGGFGQLPLLELVETEPEHLN